MCHRKVSDAEAEAVKKNEEKAKVWKTNQPSNSSSAETTPNSSVEIVPKVPQAPASSSEPRSHSSPVDSKTDADDLPSECRVSCLMSHVSCLVSCVYQGTTHSNEACQRLDAQSQS